MVKFGNLNLGRNLNFDEIGEMDGLTDAKLGRMKIDEDLKILES